MNCTALNRTVQKEVETQYGKQNTDNRLICLLIQLALGNHSPLLNYKGTVQTHVTCELRAMLR